MIAKSTIAIFIFAAIMAEKTPKPETVWGVFNEEPKTQIQWIEENKVDYVYCDILFDELKTPTPGPKAKSEGNKKATSADAGLVDPKEVADKRKVKSDPTASQRAGQKEVTEIKGKSKVIVDGEAEIKKSIKQAVEDELKNEDLEDIAEIEVNVTGKKVDVEVVVDEEALRKAEENLLKSKGANLDGQRILPEADKMTQYKFALKCKNAVLATLTESKKKGVTDTTVESVCKTGNKFYISAHKWLFFRSTYTIEADKQMLDHKHLAYYLGNYKNANVQYNEKNCTFYVNFASVVSAVFAVFAYIAF